MDSHTVKCVVDKFVDVVINGLGYLWIVILFSVQLSNGLDYLLMLCCTDLLVQITPT